MPLATYSLTPETDITTVSVLPRGTMVTYTCLEGNEYTDEAVSKVAECSLGGTWAPDLPNDSPCEREYPTATLLNLFLFICIYIFVG